MIGDEGVEIGLGEHPARAPGAVAGLDVAQRPQGDVPRKRLGRATKLSRRLARCVQTIGRGSVALLARRARLNVPRLIVGKRGGGLQAPGQDIAFALLDSAPHPVITTERVVELLERNHERFTA